jgi:hypothetical protein
MRCTPAAHGEGSDEPACCGLRTGSPLRWIHAPYGGSVGGIIDRKSLNLIDNKLKSCGDPTDLRRNEGFLTLVAQPCCPQCSVLHSSSVAGAAGS